ncbi:MAG: ADP-ribosylglycohydrolase family protein [Calditrichae bacterium]|nr:ADP-ribosylglycohydrolase family protein [Calditrichia bacterium]
MNKHNHLKNARLSLLGLSIGDAFGDCIQKTTPIFAKTDRYFPECEWIYTDDTVMAISIYENLKEFGEINQDDLAKRFKDKFVADPSRMYGMSTVDILLRIHKGEHWRNLVSTIRPGGSFGNGSAMRVAPLGAYFFDDPERAALEAEKSAVVTHAHPEARAGAIAVALAACFCSKENGLSDIDLLKKVMEFTPVSNVQDGLLQAIELFNESVQTVARALGTGGGVSCQDTVPFCVWCAAKNSGNFENALWDAVQEPGDRDTVCAIVGGIVASSVADLPEHFIEKCEKLPSNI